MKKKMFYGAGPFIFQNAKNLRNNVTVSEMIFWAHLKSRFPSYHFRRQHPISGYVADFYSHKLKLVIEIDGSIHDLESVKKKDEAKETHLISQALKVIRFTNDEIKHQLEKCLDEVQKFIDEKVRPPVLNQERQCAPPEKSVDSPFRGRNSATPNFRVWGVTPLDRSSSYPTNSKSPT